LVYAELIRRRNLIEVEEYLGIKGHGAEIFSVIPANAGIQRPAGWNRMSTQLLTDEPIDFIPNDPQIENPD